LKISKGTLRSEGRWTIAGDNSRRLRFTWRADAIDTSPLIAELIPRLKNNLEGQLSGRAQFDAAAGPGASLRDALGGDGETAIERGVIKHFNLLRQLLLGGSDGSAEIAARLPPSIAGLLNHRDTPFDSLKANFILEQKRIRTENLVMTTPDYTITGAGWMGLDRSTRWNGLIVLSPRLTQEMQRDYRMFRYLLDRRGRLAISFRLEGTIPNVKIRLDNRALAQLLRSGAPPGDSDSDNQSGEATQEGKAWLPDALERFLNR
jgi:AsmA-like C-terminal region